MAQGGGSEGTVPDLRGSLREVINRGAKIFNENGDHAGCYRLYEGALVALRPVLEKPLQQEIDRGLANTTRMASYSDKAFELRRVLDRIREQSGEKGAKVMPPVTKEKLGEPKKTKIDDSKTPIIEKESKGDVIGKVTLDDKPLEKGTITLLDAKGKPKYVVIIEKGRFKFGNVDTGKYRIVIQSPKKGVETLPPRYSVPDQSTLTLEIRPGRSTFDIKLQLK